MEKTEVKNILEFALLAAGGPLGMADFRRLLNGDGGGADGDIRGALATLEEEWRGRGLRLAKAAGGWQMISAEGYLEYLRRLRPKKPARLSRQLMEVLAVVAYRQPATRGDIEQMRGVSVSSVQLAALEELGWIEEVGRRDTPGRPMLYGTTATFLHDLAISSLDELPPLEEEDMEEGFGNSEDEPVPDSESDSVPDSDSQNDSQNNSESRDDSESEFASDWGNDSENDSEGDSESRGEV